MLKIIMLRGLPASGKTTWAKEQMKTGNYINISSKTIQKDILGGYSIQNEKDVIKIRNQLIRQGIKLNKNIIIDDTNLDPKNERTIRQIAKELKVEFEVNDSFMDVPVEVCVKRDLTRKHSVGPNRIHQLVNKWINKPTNYHLDENWDKKRCVIFDIDGTLAHNEKGRDIYDYTRVGEDTADMFLVAIADALNQSVGDYYLDIIIITGREDSSRQQTETWLRDNMIPFKELHMRKSGDKREDTIIKEEVYYNEIEPNYCVLGVFDDRPKVCRMWRRLGLKTAQMGNPDYEF